MLINSADTITISPRSDTSGTSEPWEPLTWVAPGAQRCVRVFRCMIRCMFRCMIRCMFRCMFRCMVKTVCFEVCFDVCLNRRLDECSDLRGWEWLMQLITGLGTTKGYSTHSGRGTEPLAQQVDQGPRAGTKAAALWARVRARPVRRPWSRPLGPDPFAE